MRLICTLSDQEQAYALSALLQEKGIVNELDVTTHTDWGSPDYGTIACRIWVREEDQVAEAMQVMEAFQQNPTSIPLQKAPTTAETVQPPTEEEAAAEARQPIGPMTLYLVTICAILLTISSMTSPTITIKSVPEGVPTTPLLAAPIEKDLMFDYPKAFEIIDQIIETYGQTSLETPDTLPEAGKELLNQFHLTPYWKGIYDNITAWYRNVPSTNNLNAPMFEKIRQGEIWRLFSPALMHGNIFHLFFNMAWLVILGRQMEQRLGKLRYLLFILIGAAIPNIAQYLMSGSEFLGFSGVVCAMVVFVWTRQRHTAWEGYLLDKSTMIFISAFVILMCLIQLGSFFLEAYTNADMPIGIANTAHLTGAIIGWILGRMSFFSWRNRWA
ncbi:MAG: rhomboid family intramembrane serine protease [Parachlamydiaceae bacterium]|nr:rhomboid family intramembrane serine protease [Parachlamydiaceae bacterium]